MAAGSVRAIVHRMARRRQPRRQRWVAVVAKGGGLPALGARELAAETEALADAAEGGHVFSGESATGDADADDGAAAEAVAADESEKTVEGPLAMRVSVRAELEALSLRMLDDSGGSMLPLVEVALSKTAAVSGAPSYEILYTVVKKGNSCSSPFIFRMWFTSLAVSVPCSFWPPSSSASISSRLFILPAAAKASAHLRLRPP